MMIKDIPALSRRIEVATTAVYTALTRVNFQEFISGSTAINYCTENDVDVVVRAPVDAAAKLLFDAGWEGSCPYPTDLWRSFKKRVEGVVVNILLCTSEDAFLRAKLALKACIMLREAGLLVDKPMRIRVHEAIMGDKS
jgi:hypothetical protein